MILPSLFQSFSVFFFLVNFFALALLFERLEQARLFLGFP